MLWILFWVGVVGDIFYGVKFLYELFQYWDEIEMCKSWSDEWHTVYPSRQFPLDTLKVCIILCIVCFLIWTLMNKAIEIQSIIEEEIVLKKLLALNTGDVLKGNGGGSGIHFAMSIESQSVYSYYYLRDDGGYHRESIEADDTTIYEIENCFQPRVEKHNIYRRFKNPTVMYILFLEGMELQSYHYKLIVPKGSIIRSYNLQ